MITRGEYVEMMRCSTAAELQPEPQLTPQIETQSHSDCHGELPSDLFIREFPDDHRRPDRV